MPGGINSALRLKRSFVLKRNVLLNMTPFFLNKDISTIEFDTWKTAILTVIRYGIRDYK